MKRIYEYSKLRGRITEKLGNNKTFAEKLDISEAALYNKLQNKVPFNQDEIMIAKSKDVLDIDDNEVCKYFFEPKLGKTQSIKKKI